MRRILMMMVLSSLCVAGAAAQQPGPAEARAGAVSPGTEAARPRRPVATYSIVARDPATGELGVAVQSHWFSVGSIVSWAEAGVGAVATQSFVDPSYGPLGLELMRAGRSAPDALRGLVEADAGRDVRQVAMIDAQGRVAAYTGKKCILAAGHHVGENYSVQANLMERDTVWGAMARAFESAQGDLLERLLAALEAAEREGGDIRGRQSAAILIVRPASSGRPWSDRAVDLRVEDHPEPLKEIRRLANVHRAYQHMNAGDLCAEKKDWDCAAREYGAAERYLPGNPEVVFWHAVTLVTGGRVEQALPLFGKVFAADRRWAELVGRLPHSELLPDDAALIQRIQAQAPREPAAAPGAGDGVGAVLSRIVAADNAGDLEAIVGLYAEDAVLLPPGAAPVEGRAAIAEHYRKLFAQYSMWATLDSAETLVAGEWAFNRGTVTVELIPKQGGETTRARDRYLMVLRREPASPGAAAAGGWRIARLIWSPAPR